MLLSRGRIKFFLAVVLFCNFLYPSDPGWRTQLQNKRVAARKAELLASVAAVFQQAGQKEADSKLNARNLLAFLRAPELGFISSDRRTALIVTYCKKNRLKPYDRKYPLATHLVEATQDNFPIF